MVRLAIVPDDPALAQFIGSINAVAGGSGFGMKRTSEVFERIVNSMASAWKRTLGPEDGKTVKIQKKSPFSYDIYSESEKVSWREYGLPAFDMKQTHTKGVKSRVIKPRKTKSGKTITQWKAKRKDGSTYTVRAGDSYLIVPFRHGTQSGSRYKGGRAYTPSGALRAQLSDIVGSLGKNDFKRSKIMSSPEGSGKSEVNALGKMIERAKYKWGDRLELPDTEENEDLQGMVAMQAGRGSTFMTFRVISMNSPAGSWMHPGFKAENNVTKIATMGQAQITEAMEAAMREDLGL